MGVPFSAGIWFATTLGFWALFLEFPAIMVNTLIESPPAQNEFYVLYAATVTYFQNGHYILYLLAFMVIWAVGLMVLARGLSKFLDSSNKYDRYFSRFVLFGIPCIIGIVLYAVVHFDFL